MVRHLRSQLATAASFRARTAGGGRPLAAAAWPGGARPIPGQRYRQLPHRCGFPATGADTRGADRLAGLAGGLPAGPRRQQRPLKRPLITLIRHLFPAIRHLFPAIRHLFPAIRHFLADLSQKPVPPPRAGGGFETKTSKQIVLNPPPGGGPSGRATAAGWLVSVPLRVPTTRLRRRCWRNVRQ